MSKMSQIQTTLKPKDIEAVKNRAEALFNTTLGKIDYNRLIQNKGFREPERESDRLLNEGQAVYTCFVTYHKYWNKLERKIKNAPHCSKDGIEYMERMQKRAEYACEWLMQIKAREVKFFYAMHPDLVASLQKIKFIFT